MLLQPLQVPFELCLYQTAPLEDGPNKRGFAPVLAVLSSPRPPSPGPYGPPCRGLIRPCPSYTGMLAMTHSLKLGEMGGGTWC
jgi:hypothetical protein